MCHMQLWEMTQFSSWTNVEWRGLGIEPLNLKALSPCQIIAGSKKNITFIWIEKCHTFCFQINYYNTWMFKTWRIPRHMTTVSRWDVGISFSRTTYCTAGVGYPLGRMDGGCFQEKAKCEVLSTAVVTGWKTWWNSIRWRICILVTCQGIQATQNYRITQQNNQENYWCCSQAT